MNGICYELDIIAYIIADMRTKAAKNLIFALQVHLEQVKADIKDNTNITQVENQLQTERNMAYINNCWGGPSRAALSPGNIECSNYKLLTMKIKILEAILAMERHPDDHACQSAAILHELLNEMENLRVE
ncbi:hypothetical protein Tco_1110320 [Tanacetum coccineum]|uniref:Uncharacterized protein n=1 Tax=Tanacetum coccineum TaxID=301880 RepID=A0ABQ5IIJ1_9ASTR